MPFKEPPPKPPPPTVRRFDANGLATKDQRDYEQALREYLLRLAAAIT